MTTRILPTLTIVGALWWPVCAAAQDRTLDVAALAGNLNITEDQARDCLPASLGSGQRPSRSERNQALACFKSANPSLSDGDVRNALRSMAQR